MYDLDGQLVEYAQFLERAVAPVEVPAAPARRADAAPLDGRRRRPLLVLTAGFALTLVAGATTFLLLGRRQEPTVATSPTTVSSSIPPGARFTWTRVEDTTGALSGEGAEYVSQVIPGGPGLVAVGAADESGTWQSYTETGWAENSRYEEYRGGAVWTSPDGEVWTRIPYDEATFGSGVATLTGVADGGARLVAVGIAENQAGWGSAVWISDDDGASWTRVPHDEEVFGGEGLHRMYAVIATPDGFVAAGDDLWTSPDGWQWSRVGPMAVVYRIARTEDGYVAVGAAGGWAAVWMSPDAVSWARVEPAVPGVFGTPEDPLHAVTALLADVAAGPDGVVAVGQVKGETPSPDKNAAVWLATPAGVWSRVEHDPAVFGTENWHQEIRGVTRIGDVWVAVGTQRPHNAANDPVDARFGPALAWVSRGGGRSWIPVQSEALGDRGADISATAVTTLGDKVVAMGSDGTDLVVWIGTWE